MVPVDIYECHKSEFFSNFDDICSVCCIIADLVGKVGVGENPGKIDKNGDCPSSVAIL